MGLAKKVLKMVDENNTLKGKLADGLDKSLQTIDRWIRNNDERLTTSKALSIMESELEMTQEEILTK